MTENQTRPELSKQAHHLLHEAIGNEEKCKDCDYYQKRDFHAKPICVASYTLILCRQHNCDHEKWIVQKDVLKEREAYETQYASDREMIKRMREHFDEKHDAWVREKRRAEAVEAELKDAQDYFKTYAETAYANQQSLEKKLKKAEARI